MTFLTFFRRAVLCSIPLFLVANSQTATFSGHITDFNNDTPISGVRVTVYDTESGECDSTSTDKNGDWSMSFQSSIDEPLSLPQEFRVLQNYPNPFNPTTTLPFYIPADGSVEIIVSNLLGQTIDYRRQFLTRGSYSTTWKSKGSAGVYFYTIRIGQKQITRKMIQLDGG